MKRTFSILTGALASLTLGSLAQAQVVVTIDAPGVQASTVPSVTTETFDSFTPGFHTTLSTPVGTYSGSGFEVVPANAVGGAGGTGNYFAVGSESGTLSETLMLPGNEGYFGIWFSAGDPLNVLKLYENSTLEYTLNTAGLINFVNMQADASAYYGNPNNREDPGEPFVYVNFFGTGSTVFNTVVFSNLSTASGFESDNQSIGPTVPVTGIPLTPEPGSYALLGSLSLTGAALLRRKRVR